MLTEDSDAEMKEREQFEDQYHKLAAAARGLLSARRCQQRDNGSVSSNDDVQRHLVTHLTYEEMSTCLTQVEAILNSRPLTQLSSDPFDLSPLTPAHFLIGRSLISIPHPQIIDDHITRLDRYKRIEHIKQHFWQRFSLEYVSQLQQKLKWQDSRSEIKLGSLVLIKDRTLPPLLWSLGRVIATYPGSDGIVRVAELRTKRGTIRRAFNNICPLPEL
ncbi:uncharacterized protein LOC114364299 [Ostrinia furnacalis]|uniref:uncharacterized protein LOC114364299 n=1 Tax=Ostrinia furnacalis TaxID=93504 RepID=UPI001039E3F2|nr:uncharacterized protein LOC114364299 [Ostrinia furnacalis]